MSDKMENNNIIVKWSGSRDLHPKAKFPFFDNNNVEHKSVAEAFLRVTEGKSFSLKVVLEVLFRIILTQVGQVVELKSIMLASAGKAFIFVENDPKYLPFHGWGLVEGVGANLYGQVLRRVRDHIVAEVQRAGALAPASLVMPEGTQPCLRCCGDDHTAGNGHFLAVAGNYPSGWKHKGPCFDCTPKGDHSGRGKGYVTRSQARSNWTYAYHNQKRWNDNHQGCEANLYNPDDDSLWKITPKCSVCGSDGIMLYGAKKMCKPCLEANSQDCGVRMDEVKIEKEDIPL